MARFYNPGFKFEDRLRYENQLADRESNNISYYLLSAPEKSFFDVKENQTIKLPTGEEYEIPLRFKHMVRETYRERGVILVDDKREDILDEENVANGDAAAKKKGDRMWRDFLMDKAREWQQIVEECRNNGGIPRRATGLFARVLEELAMQDPADTVGIVATAKADAAKSKEEAGTISELRAMIIEQGKQIAALTGKHA